MFDSDQIYAESRSCWDAQCSLDSFSCTETSFFSKYGFVLLTIRLFMIKKLFLNMREATLSYL